MNSPPFEQKLPTKNGKVPQWALKALVRRLLNGGGVPAFFTKMEHALATLPSYCDDITRDLGEDIYKRMRTDSAVKAGLSTAKSLVLSEGLQWHPSFPAPPAENPTPEETEHFNRANETLKWLEAQMKWMAKPPNVRTYQMLSCLENGHSIAEIMLKVDNGLLVLDDLKPLDRRTVSMVVDETMTVVGIVEARAINSGRLPGLGNPAVDGREMFPREKFAIFTHNPEDNDDPRGTSILREAYNPWYVKQTFWPGLGRGMGTLANGSLIAIAPPEDQGTATDDMGEPEEAALGEDITAILEEWQNSSVATLPNGTEIQEVGGKDIASNYDGAFSIVNREIMLAILSQVRSNLEAEHGSKADSETGKNILDMQMSIIRQSIQGVWFKEVAYRIVALNFGDEFARLYTPIPLLGTGPQEDFAKIASAVAALFNAGYFGDEQLPYLDQKMGLPVHDMKAWRAEKEAKTEREDRMNQMIGSATKPDEAIEDEEGDDDE